jgi:hypothetical protein
MGEMVNYMQIDTGRLEYVAGSIHTVWDGILQVYQLACLLLLQLVLTAILSCLGQIIGYTGLLLYFLGPSVFAGIAAMLFILPLNAYFLHK